MKKFTGAILIKLWNSEYDMWKIFNIFMSDFIVIFW